MLLGNGVSVDPAFNRCRRFVTPILVPRLSAPPDVVLGVTSRPSCTPGHTGAGSAATDE